MTKPIVGHVLSDFDVRLTGPEDEVTRFRSYVYALERVAEGAAMRASGDVSVAAYIDIVKRDGRWRQT